MATPTRKRAATTRKPATRKKTTTRKTAPKTEPTVVPTFSPEERQAKFVTYEALTNAGLPIPAELEAWVQGEIGQAALIQAQSQQRAEENESKLAAKLNVEGPWYVRNCYNAPFNLRLDRQTEKRRLELKARGVPGDMHPLKDEDLQDPVLVRNQELGLLEIIPAGEAHAIVQQQTTNLTHREHTPLAVLRNELGQEYPDGAVKTMAEWNAQGITVAQVDPRLMQGQMHDREVGGVNAHGGITRVTPGQQQPVVRSAFVPTGGNPAIVSQQPPLIGPDAQARVADDLARRTGTVPQLKVTVEPTRHT